MQSANLPRFNGSVHLSTHLQVVGLRRWDLILPKTWPTWTMVLQALGSVRLCWEGMQAALPEVCSPQVLQRLLDMPLRLHDVCMYVRGRLT